MNSARKWFGISCFIGAITANVEGSLLLKEVWPTINAAQARAAAGAPSGNDVVAQPNDHMPRPTVARMPDGPKWVKRVQVAQAQSPKSGDFQSGKKQFKQCAACHTVTEGGKNKVGPNLWGIVGRDVAALDSFKYSKALRKVDGVWTHEFLDRYLKSPRRAVKGTRMAFAGIKNDNKRADLLAFLAAQSSGAVATKSANAESPARTAEQNNTNAQAAKQGSTDAKSLRLAKLRERGQKFILKDLKLPEGIGKDETEAYCGACHSMRLVVQQGQTREGWDELLEYMVEEHAMEPLPVNDRKLVLDYLAENYGVKRKRARRIQ